MPLEKLRILNRFDAALARFLVTSLAKADRDALNHSIATAEVCHMFATKAGGKAVSPETLWLAGFLHDIGKLGIEEKILNKRAHLSTKEKKQVEAHVTLGKIIVDRLFKAPHLGLVVQHHHERYDGKGYPAGLVGNDIPYMARVVAVASTYDTVRSAGWMLNWLSHQAALTELTEQAGKQFDPDVVTTFVKMESQVFTAHKAARALNVEDIYRRL